MRQTLNVDVNKLLKILGRFNIPVTDLNAITDSLGVVRLSSDRQSRDSGCEYGNQRRTHLGKPATDIQ